MKLLQNPRYQVVAKIGEGATALVFEARDTYTVSSVCIKVQRTSKDDNLRATLAHEARILKTLTERSNSRYFSRLRDSWIENGRLCLAIDFVQGVTLGQYLKSVPELNFTKKKELLFRVSQAVSEIHSSNVVHRDISPSNIIVTDKNDVVLIDFGTSSHPLYQICSDFKGTPGFSAYEIERGEHGRSVDIYSLTAIAYFILTSNIPISAFDRVKYGRSVSFFHPIFLTRPYLKGALSAGLSLSNESRPQNVGDWKALIDGRATQMYVATPSNFNNSSAGIDGQNKIPLVECLVLGVAYYIFAKADSACEIHSLFDKSFGLFHNLVVFVGYYIFMFAYPTFASLTFIFESKNGRMLLAQIWKNVIIFLSITQYVMFLDVLKSHILSAFMLFCVYFSSYYMASSFRSGLFFKVAVSTLRNSFSGRNVDGENLEMRALKIIDITSIISPSLISFIANKVSCEIYP
jgi:serine/threonine protein kinase